MEPYIAANKSIVAAQMMIEGLRSLKANPSGVDNNRPAVAFPGRAGSKPEPKSLILARYRAKIAAKRVMPRTIHIGVQYNKPQ